MFVVKRCVQDYEDVWKTEVCRFSTREEAEDFAIESSSWNDFGYVWYEIHEEQF